MCSPMREVLCADAVDWLESHSPQEATSVVASLPDISEFPSYTLATWEAWFTRVSQLAIRATPPQGVSIFFQTDIKYQEQWVDKAFLCQSAARQEGVRLLWHKVACRAPAGQATFGRPGFSHVLCFSRSFTLECEHSSADVLPDVGEKTWERGMGLNVCVMIAKFLAERVGCKKLIHPFCGQGGMLAAANSFGMDAFGIERSPKRAEQARRLRLQADRSAWIEDTEARTEVAQSTRF